MINDMGKAYNIKYCIIYIYVKSNVQKVDLIRCLYD